ncbi:hypothetical protein [Streptomyces sp. NPDC014734]
MFFVDTPETPGPRPPCGRDATAREVVAVDDGSAAARVGPPVVSPALAA